MTEAELALVRQNVEELYRGTRRSWQGFGGNGNPYETWDDLKGMAGLSFVLDSDAVFTPVGWATSRLIDFIKKIRAQCASIIAATEQLVSSAKSIQDMDPLIRSYAMLARQVMEVRRGGRADVGAARRDAIRRELTTFAQTNLVPAVTSSSQDGSARSPAEARSYIRTATTDLFALMDQVDTAVDSLTSVVPSMQATVPSRVALSWLQKIRDRVGATQLRMQLQLPEERAAQAMEDLTQLSADMATLDLTGASTSPVLERGTFSCDAAGSGVGAVIQGLTSAPYYLVTGYYDALYLEVNGAAATTINLPSISPTFEVRFPVSASKDAPPPVTQFYVIPGGGAKTLFLVVDGVIGDPASFVAGANMTTTDVVAALNVAGVIPHDALAVDYLVIDEVLVGPAGSGFNTVRITYNAAATPVIGIGSHIMIFGSPDLMAVFGFIPTFDTDWPYMFNLTEWKGVSRSQVAEALRSSLSPDVVIEQPIDVVASGLAYTKVGTTMSVHFSHYFGSGVWEEEGSRLTLVGDELKQVVVGDRVYINGALSGVVETIEVDGVIVDTTTGTPPASGSYSVAVTPASSTIPVDSTLELTYRRHSSQYRVSSVGHAADGRLDIGVTRAIYASIFGVLRLDGRVFMDTVSMRSADNSPNGTLELVAGARNAAAVLGMSLGLVASQVDQLAEAASGDFVAAGVMPGDVVRPVSGPDWIVDTVISPTRIRVTPNVSGSVKAAPVTIYNYRYLYYNEELVAELPSWSSVPSQESISREAAEAVRAEGMQGAGNRLKALMQQLETTAGTLETALLSYRAICGAPSPFMQDLRETLEEAGADRAVDYLQSARVQEMLGFSADDANSSRQVLRSMRVLGRKALGTSIFVAAREQEQNALLRQDNRIYIDGTPLPIEQIGPPRRAQR